MPRTWSTAQAETHVSLDGNGVPAFCGEDAARALSHPHYIEEFTNTLDHLDLIADTSPVPGWRVCGTCRHEVIERAKMEELFWLVGA